MNQRTVFFVSDQTGVTAETMGHSLLTQFDGVDFRQVTIPFISTLDKADGVVRKINQTAKLEGSRPIVFSTLVQDELRDRVKKSDGLFLDFFDAFLGPLEKELKQKSTHTTGRAHGMRDMVSYTNRIEATNFAMANDDGVISREFGKADIILIGVSRSGKTPTCLYMALQYGVYAANFPLTDEVFEKGDLPGTLKKNMDKLYGLTITTERLLQIRRGRRPNGKYSTPQQVDYEIREAERFYKRYGIPFIDTSECSIEEIASKALIKKGVERRVRP